MRRTARTWSVILGLVLVAFAGTVVALNSTLYSAAGFVESYLSSLARHDIAGALALPGVTQPLGSSDDLLDAEVVGELTDIELVSDEPAEAGQHSVIFSYSIGGRPGQSQFTVERSGTTLWLFSGWRFALSPISTVELTVLHDSRFTANGVKFASPAEPDESAEYAVLTPGLYRFGHESTYLTSDVRTAAVTEVGREVDIVVDVQANRAFEQAVEDELVRHLDENCVTQEVLLPTACPFGQPMSNRVVSTPEWSMTEYPDVSIEPGDQPGTWRMPETPGSAHLVVDVQSLFDGSISTFDQDVEFTVSYLITFIGDDQPYIEQLL